MDGGDSCGHFYVRLYLLCPIGTVLMYDYDLNRLCEAFHRFGIEHMCLAHEDHGGHHGVKIFGQRKR